MLTRIAFVLALLFPGAVLAEVEEPVEVFCGLYVKTAKQPDEHSEIHSMLLLKYRVEHNRGRAVRAPIINIRIIDDSGLTVFSEDTVLPDVGRANKGEKRTVRPDIAPGTYTATVDLSTQQGMKVAECEASSVTIPPPEQVDRVEWERDQELEAAFMLKYRCPSSRYKSRTIGIDEVSDVYRQSDYVESAYFITVSDVCQLVLAGASTGTVEAAIEKAKKADTLMVVSEDLVAIVRIGAPLQIQQTFLNEYLALRREIASGMPRLSLGNDIIMFEDYVKVVVAGASKPIVDQFAAAINQKPVCYDAELDKSTEEGEEGYLDCWGLYPAEDEGESLFERVALCVLDEATLGVASAVSDPDYDEGDAALALTALYLETAFPEHAELITSASFLNCVFND